MSKRYEGMSHQLGAAVFDKIEPEWGPDRQQAVRDAIAHRARRQRGLTRAAVAVVATGVVAVGGFAFVRGRAVLSGADPSASAVATVRNARPSPATVQTLTVTQLSPDT